MKSYVALTAAALLGITRLARAATIMSPALLTGTNTAGACYIRNVGAKPISLQAPMLQNFSPDFPIVPSFQNCNNAPLAAGKTCVVLVNDLPDDVTFACSAAVVGSVSTIACLLGLLSAHADQTIASPAIFGALTQTKAGCFIGNGGTSPVSLAANIFDESGNVVSGSSSCGAPVQPGFSCSVFAPISSGVAYACSARAIGSSASKLRGTLVLFEAKVAVDVPLRSAELR